MGLPQLTQTSITGYPWPIPKILQSPHGEYPNAIWAGDNLEFAKIPSG